MKSHPENARDFDKKFDDARQDVTDDLDLSSAKRINKEQKRINVDLPSSVVESLDRDVVSSKS